MCRRLQDPIEETLPQDFLLCSKNFILSYLQQVFCAHNKFMNSSNAEEMFCKLSNGSHVAKEVAQKLEFLI